jgi:2'-5' RNA ligase
VNKGIEPRLFVAVPLPAEVRERLSALCAELKQRWDFSRWVHREDYHITVQFLGNCDLDQMERIIAELSSLSEHQPPFILRLQGIGTFGRPEQPRILWAGVDGDLAALHDLQEKVVRLLTPIGFPPEDRPYRPHVTVARKCLSSGFPPRPDQLVRLGSEVETSWTVEEIVLYETRLGQRPMYHAVRRFPFGRKQ